MHKRNHDNDVRKWAIVSYENWMYVSITDGYPTNGYNTIQNIFNSRINDYMNTPLQRLAIMNTT